MLLTQTLYAKHLAKFFFNSPDMLKTTTTAVEKGYLLTSVTGLYLALGYTNH